MIANLQPYPEYKESGLPWLRGIPRHWNSGPGFAAFREKQVKNTGMQEKTVLSLSYGRIVVKPPEKLHGLVPDSFETYQIVNPGDIIIRSTDLQNDWNSLRVGLVRDRGIITSAYLCFCTTGMLSPEYGYQLLHSFDLMKVFYGLGSGLRQNLDWSDFKRMLIFIPPPEEQAAMVRFLDYANGRLERAIWAKRKVIALLHEQKQAVIHRAVTRGLDPTVPLRPSGIPWLGDIPKHWVTTRVKFASRKISKGDTPSNLGREFTDGGPVKFIKIENIGAGEILEHPAHTIDFETHRLLKRSQLHENDIVYAIAGATTGKAAIVRAHHLPANTNQAVAFIRPNERIVPSYLVTWLHGPGLKKAMWLLTVQSAQPNLSMEELGNLPLLLPPKNEQSDILQSVSREQEPLNTAISRLGREISLLREYRTRLVADVVTGKLDVRGITLPSESEPPAALAAETIEQDSSEPEEAENPSD